jgi:hypothetical protein
MRSMAIALPNNDSIGTSDPMAQETAKAHRYPAQRTARPVLLDISVPRDLIVLFMIGVADRDPQLESWT